MRNTNGSVVPLFNVTFQPTITIRLLQDIFFRAMAGSRRKSTNPRPPENMGEDIPYRVSWEGTPASIARTDRLLRWLQEHEDARRRLFDVNRVRPGVSLTNIRREIARAVFQEDDDPNIDKHTTDKYESNVANRIDT